MNKILMLALALAAVALLGVPAGQANAPGATLYAPTSDAEYLAYARVIRLAHSGKANGTLLASYHTCFRRRDGSGTPLGDHVAAVPVRTSSTHGEIPGRNAAGGQCLPAGHHRDSFPSLAQPGPKRALGLRLDVPDRGTGRPGRGIWEPFLGLDKTGNLVCYFSDERQHATYSQCLGHIISHDGGDTWIPEVPDVASTHQPDRPGMATVANLPDSTYRMTYEVCGPTGCDVHMKASVDGDTWGDGPADLGPRIETTDGRYLIGSPYLVWSPGDGPQGRLLLAAHAEARTAGGLAPESGQVIFINTRNGHGSWRHIRATANL